MQASYISPQMYKNPEYNAAKHFKALQDGVEYAERQWVKKPAGFVVTHPDAYKLVQMGIAEAADDECREKLEDLGWSDARIWNARIAQRRVAKGIHPDDYEAFANGEIDGYTGDGAYVPGPNMEDL